MSQPQSTSEDDLLTLFFMLFGGIATGAFSFGAVLLEPMRDWMLQYHLLEQGDTVLIPLPFLDTIGFGMPQLLVIAGLVLGGIVLGISLRRRAKSHI